jgi:PAS domain S-box-containing protein
MKDGLAVNRGNDRPGDAAASARPGEALRRRAEEIAGKAAQSAGDSEAMSPEELRRTLHELRVHQIELELQNEELRKSEAELDASRARYFDLFDLAPASYCTIGGQGLILEANLTAAALLGLNRGALAGRQITRFIRKEDQDLYYFHCKRILEAGAPQGCELRMVKDDETAFWAHLQVTAAQDEGGAPVMRVVLTDISERKRAEEAQRQAFEMIKTLRGILPICMRCKMIRDDQGHWNPMEVYVRERTEAEFSYSFCPECMKEFYPEAGGGAAPEHR